MVVFEKKVRGKISKWEFCGAECRVHTQTI